MNNKQFIMQSVAFLILVGVGIYFINDLYEENVLAKKTSLRKDDAFQDFLDDSAGSQLDFVFFGDSKTETSMDPSIVPNSINLAVTGQKLTTIENKFKRLLDEEDIEIRNIVIEFDIHAYSLRVTDIENNQGGIQTRTLATQDRAITPEAIRLSRRTLEWHEVADVYDQPEAKLRLIHLIPVLGNGQEFEGNFSEGDIIVQQGGFFPNPQNFSEIPPDEKANIIAERADTMFAYPPRLEPTTKESFQNVLFLAKTHNITPILVLLPRSDDWEEALIERGIDREAYEQLQIEAVEEITNEYVLLDYVDIFGDRDELFGDGVHTNAAGAELISKQFLNDVLLQNLTSGVDRSSVPNLEGTDEVTSSYHYQKMFAGPISRYNRLLPPHYNPENEYPTVLVFPPSDQRKESMEATSEIPFITELAERGWVVIVLQAPESEFAWEQENFVFFGREVEFRLHSFIESFTKYNPEGGKFYLLGMPGTGGISTFSAAYINPDRVHGIVALSGFPRDVAIVNFTNTPTYLIGRENSSTIHTYHDISERALQPENYVKRINVSEADDSLLNYLDSDQAIIHLEEVRAIVKGNQTE